MGRRGRKHADATGTSAAKGKPRAVGRLEGKDAITEALRTNGVAPVWTKLHLDVYDDVRRLGCLDGSLTDEDALAIGRNLGKDPSVILDCYGRLILAKAVDVPKALRGAIQL